MTVTCCTECWAAVDEADVVEVEDGRRCPDCQEDSQTTDSENDYREHE